MEVEAVVRHRDVVPGPVAVQPIVKVLDLLVGSFILLFGRSRHYVKAVPAKDAEVDPVIVIYRTCFFDRVQEKDVFE